MIPDNQLRAECFNALVDHFGYLDTERFVVMMSRSPEDYTTWHQRRFGNDESVRELGEKIKKFAAAKRQTRWPDNNPNRETEMKGTSPIQAPIPAFVMVMRQDVMRRERVPDDVRLRVAVWMDRQPEAVPTSSFVTISRAR